MKVFFLKQSTFLTTLIDLIDIKWKGEHKSKSQEFVVNITTTSHPIHNKRLFPNIFTKQMKPMEN